MRNKKLLRPLVALLLAGAATGCQDLEVVNENDPDNDRALNSAADVETLIASSWRDKWNRLQNTSSSYNVMPVVADVLTATYANDAALELSSEPRPPLNNNPTAQASGVVRFGWESWYQAISSASDGLGAIRDGLRITTGPDGEDNTTRAWAFGKWMQGIAHGFLALAHDQAFVVTEHYNVGDIESVEELLATVPLLEYPLVLDSAIKFIEQAIDTLEVSSFRIPETWIPDNAYTSQELARIGHSYIAAFLTYNARTPEERAAVDWERVIRHVDQGITEDYAIALSTNLLRSNYHGRAQTTGSFSAWADYKLVGPADVSGTYAAWLAMDIGERDRFRITTPDRRITGPTPASSGSYFRYRADNIFVPQRGLYHHSHYQWFRHRFATGSHCCAGEVALMSVDEMNLIKAEALIRLGREAEAVPLINSTRTRPQRIGTVTYPGLPPVTVSGVPESADCVPRLDGVTCANLLDALQYERMIELVGASSWRGWHDSRGWGRLPPGTFLHMPIPGRELEALSMPIYSFGGVGGPGAAQ